MANPTKKLAEHANPEAQVRVYMDISSADNAVLEEVARANGRTKKGQLAFMVSQLAAQMAVQAAEQAVKKHGKKKGRK